MTCRAATSATTCAGSTPTGAPLAYDNEGRLAAWQNAPGSSLTQSASYLYDGTGQRVQQVATSSGATTTTSYIGSLEEVTSSGGTTTTTTAYYGGLAESVNGALSYLLADGLGSAAGRLLATPEVEVEARQRVEALALIDRLAHRRGLQDADVVAACPARQQRRPRQRLADALAARGWRGGHRIDPRHTGMQEEL